MGCCRSTLVVICAAFACAATEARAQPTAAPVVVLWGAPDASGADAALTRWAQRRGLAVVRELPATAEATTPTAAATLAAGRAAYRALRLDEAARALDDAAALAAESGGAGLARGDLVELAVLRAACRLARGDEGAAWDDLLAAAAIAPDRPLDPAAWPPRLVAEARRAAMALGPAVSLELVVTPPDAALFVDGEPLARGTVATTLRPGRHLVRAERAGFAPRGQAIVVAAGVARARLTLSAVAPPTAAAIAARAAMARGEGARGEVLGAWIGETDGGGVALHLAAIGVGGEPRGAAAVALSPALTDGEVAAAAERLMPAPPSAPRAGGVAPSPTEDPAATAKRRRARAWTIGGAVAGAAAAVALAVGLGVGLGLSGSGLGVHVDLRGAR